MAKQKSKRKPDNIRVEAKSPKPAGKAIKQWVDNSQTEMPNLFGLDDAPDWATNALAEVVRLVLPGKKLPTSGEWELAFMGEMMGRLQAFSAIWSGEIAPNAEMLADAERLEKVAVKLQPDHAKRQAKEKAIIRDLQVKINALGQAILQMLATNLALSHNDLIKFQTGFQRGLAINIEDFKAGIIYQRYTKIFWVIGLQWQRWVKCRSVAEVHRILCAELGEKQVGSLKAFENRVAKVIGMRFGSSGRPKKLK